MLQVEIIAGDIRGAILEEEVNNFLEHCNREGFEINEIKWHHENPRLVMIVYKKNK